MKNLDKEYLEELKEIASKDSIHDNLEDGEWIDVSNHAGGNIDDAYTLGEKEGLIGMARTILYKLGEKW